MRSNSGNCEVAVAGDGPTPLKYGRKRGSERCERPVPRGIPPSTERRWRDVVTEGNPAADSAVAHHRVDFMMRHVVVIDEDRRVFRGFVDERSKTGQSWIVMRRVFSGRGVSRADPGLERELPCRTMEVVNQAAGGVAAVQIGDDLHHSSVHARRGTAMITAGRWRARVPRRVPSGRPRRSVDRRPRECPVRGFAARKRPRRGPPGSSRTR